MATCPKYLNTLEIKLLKPNPSNVILPNKKKGNIYNYRTNFRKGKDKMILYTSYYFFMNSDWLIANI